MNQDKSKKFELRPAGDMLAAPEETKKISTKETFDFFDLIHALFSTKVYATIPDRLKKKHFFMTLRFVSVKYPKEADKFNINGINEIAVMDMWHRFMIRTYGDEKLHILKNKFPEWFYAKSAMKKNAKDKFSKFSNVMIRYYLKKRKMDRRDFEEKKELYTEELFEDISRVEDFVEENNINIS